MGVLSSAAKKVIAKGIDKSAHTVESFNELGKQITNPFTRAAHLIRGTLGYRYVSRDNELKKSEISKIAKDVHEFYTSGKTGKIDPALDKYLTDSDAVSEEEKAVALIELLSTSVTPSMLKAGLAKSKVVLDRPLYVHRNNQYLSGDGPSKQSQAHLFSTEVIDPSHTSILQSLYARDGLKSLIYKLPKGAVIHHPAGYADKNEAVVDGATLIKAEQIDRTSYLASLKSGKALFAGAGVAAGVAASPDSADAGPVSSIVRAIPKIMEKAPKQVKALYGKAQTGDHKAEEQVKKYLVNKGAKTHEAQAHFDYGRYVRENESKFPPMSDRTRKNFLAGREKNSQEKFGHPLADPYEPRPNQIKGEYKAYTPKGTSDDGYEELSYVIPRYLVNPRLNYTLDHFHNPIGIHVRRDWHASDTNNELTVHEIQSDAANESKKAEMATPNADVANMIPLAPGRTIQGYRADKKSVLAYMDTKSLHYDDNEVEAYLLSQGTDKVLAHSAAVKGPALLKEIEKSKAYRARNDPFTQKLSWATDGVNRQLNDGLNKKQTAVNFILRDPNMDLTRTRSVMKWYETAYAGMVKKQAKRIGARVGLSRNSSRSLAEKYLTEYQKTGEVGNLADLLLDSDKGGLLLHHDIRDAYAKKMHILTDEVDMFNDLPDILGTVAGDLNPKDYRKYTSKLKVILPTGAAALGITFPALADESTKGPDMDPTDYNSRIETIQSLMANGTKAGDIQKSLVQNLGEQQGNAMLMRALAPKIAKLRDRGVSDEQINQSLAEHGLSLSGASPVQPDSQPGSSTPPSLPEEPAGNQIDTEKLPAGTIPSLGGLGTGQASGASKAISGFLKSLVTGPDTTLPDGSSLRETMAQVKNFRGKYLDDLKSIAGSLGVSAEYKADAAKAQQATNKVLGAVLKAKGMDFKTITSDGTVIAMKDGKEVKYDETMLDIMLAMPYEFAGGAMGTTAGAAIGLASPVPGGAIIGGSLGFAFGDGAMRGADVVRNAMLTHYQISMADTFERMGDAAASSLAFEGLGAPIIGLIKGATKGTRILGRTITNAYDKVIKGNVEGAYKTLLEGTNLNEVQAQAQTDAWLKLVDEALATPGTTANKKQVIRAVSTTTTEASSQISAAVQSSTSGGSLLRAEVAQRAKDLQANATALTSENVNSVVSQDLDNYVERVNTFFDEAKKAGIEGMQDTPYKFDFHQTAVLPAMQKAATGLTNVDASREFYKYVDLIRDAGATPIGTAPVKVNTRAARAQVVAARAKSASLRSQIAAAKKRARLFKTKKAKDKALAEAATLTKQLVNADKGIVKATGDVATKTKLVADGLQTVSAPTKGHTFEDLLKLKAILNQLSSDTRFKNATDFAQMRAARASVDKEIESAAMKHMVDGKGWLSSWKAANTEYHNMKELQTNTLYKALTSDQASAESAVKAFTKSLTYEGPKTFMQVMGKLPAKNRPLVEGAILQHLVQKHTSGEISGAQAINFPTLANELNKLAFTQKSAKDLKRTINAFAEVFKADHSLLVLTSKMPGPKFQNSLGLDPVSKAKIAVSGVLFNAIRARLPGANAGRAALSLQLGKLIDSPLNSKTIEAITRALPNDPELQTALHTLAVEYTKFGKPEHYGKVPIYRVYKPGAENKSADTTIGKGVLHYTDKAKAQSIAKLTSTKVKEVWQVHKAIATPENIKNLIGREPTPADYKDPEILSQLKRSYAGVAVKDRVILFKKNTM